MRDIRATVQSLISRCCRICKRSSGSDRRIDRRIDRRVSSCGVSGQGLFFVAEAALAVASATSIGMGTGASKMVKGEFAVVVGSEIKFFW